MYKNDGKDFFNTQHYIHVREWNKKSTKKSWNTQKFAKKIEAINELKKSSRVLQKYQQTGIHIYTIESFLVDVGWYRKKNGVNVKKSALFIVEKNSILGGIEYSLTDY